MNNAAADFFNSLPSENETEQEFDMFKEGEPEKDMTPPEKEAAVEPEPEERKKPIRSERRAEKQNEYLQKTLQEEREARIRLEEQVKALATSKKEVNPDIKKLLEGGISTEEAAEIFEASLSRVKQEALQEAIEKLQEVRGQEDEEVNQIKEVIEDQIEAIEEKYGVDLTDDTDTRNAFLDFVDSIAPEDSDALPNMQTAWRLFQATRKAPAAQTQRKATVSSRSMTRSTTARPTGENLQPISFDSINRGNFWEKLISGK